MAIEASNPIEQGYEVNDEEGTTPLFYVAFTPQVDPCVNALIGNQAHLNVKLEMPGDC